MNAELKSKKWLFAAVGFQFFVGFTISFFVYQTGTLITTGSLGQGFMPGFIAIFVAVLVIAYFSIKSGKKVKNNG